MNLHEMPHRRALWLACTTPRVAERPAAAIDPARDRARTSWTPPFAGGSLSTYPDGAPAGEPFTARRALGLIMGIAGAALLVGAGPAAVTPLTVRAAVSCLVAAGCYDFAAVYARRHLSGVTTFDTAAYSQLAAAAALLPLVPGTWPRAALTPQVLGAVLALGVVCTALVNRSAPARAVGPRSAVPGRGPSWLSRLLLRRRSGNTWRLSRRI